MQTFLPFPSFVQSAKCLDYKRLGKQRVECKQILIALGVDIGSNQGNPSSSWRSHPAVRMWEGYELALAHYAEVMCREWRERGHADALLPQFKDAYARLQDDFGVGYHPKVPLLPDWLGKDELHASHRSNLLRKDPVHYGQFNWSEPDSLPYFWPVDRRVIA